MPPKEQMVSTSTAVDAAPGLSSSRTVSDSQRDMEAALMFWLKAATDDPSLLALAPAAPLEYAEAAEPVSPRDVQRAPPGAVPANAQPQLPTEKRVSAHAAAAIGNESSNGVGNTVSSLSSRAHYRLVVHDVMPLFDALLAGQLGPVVIDIQLQGHTRLLQHPQQFEAALHGYERQSAGPLKEALGSVQPFFLLCNSGLAKDQGPPSHSSSSQQTVENAEEAVVPPFSSPSSSELLSTPALYTMAPSNHYPVVPLLAQLLHSPNVTKVLLHSRLLYRLLFLFLGTDRVDIQRVVDVTTWSELGRQLRPLLATVHPIPVDGVVELADVQSALPSEVRQLLEEETSIMTRQPRHSLLGWEHGEETESDTSVAEDVSVTSNSSYEGSSESNNNSNSSGDDVIFDDARNHSNAVSEEEEKQKDPSKAEECNEDDAVKLLRTIVPLHRWPLHSASSSSVSAAVARGGNAKRSRQQTYRRHLHNGRRGRHFRRDGSSTDSDALVSVYHGLKCVTLFYAEVLSKIFDSVTGATAPSAQTAAASSSSPPMSDPSLRYRLSPAEWCAQRTYAKFLCELMTYHGVFVNNTVFHSMNTLLDAQLRAIKHLAEQVLTAFLELATSTVKSKQTASTAVATTSMTADYFRQCIARGPAAALLAVHPKLDRSLLRALAREAAEQHNSEVATQLRLSCQLVCIWIAFQERTDAQQKITGMFGKVADRVLARVLEQPRDAMDTVMAVGRFHSPSSWCEMCFSVHPTWTLHNSSTGRIFSTQPNVQNVSKQPPLTTFSVDAVGSSNEVGLPSAEDVERWVHLASADTNASFLLFPQQPQWTMRHLYRAPPGCVLLSFDYNQLELRVLAQLSGDATLQQHLSSDVDVLTLTAASVLQLPSSDCVRPHQRQAVKVIVYGLLYGMGPKAMEERISKIKNESPCEALGNADDDGAGISNSQSGGNKSDMAGRVVPLTASQLIARLHQVYPRVESYLRETRRDGLQLFSVETLSGRKSLAAATDANRRKQRAVAQAIQGGAADIVLCAMRAVHQQRHSIVPYLPAAPLSLIMTIHDELIYVVPRGAVDEVAFTVKRILEDQARVLHLSLPLPVSVRVGKNFGALEAYRVD